MKATKFLITCILTGLFAITVNSCKKYDEGGFVSKTEKRLTAHTWKLSKYLRNGIDETTILYIKNYEETYAGVGGGSFSRSYFDDNDDFKSETGTWSFEEGEKKLIISGVGSVEITNETGTVSSSYFNILKLDKDEFWYYFDNGGDKHEFRLIKK